MSRTPRSRTFLAGLTGIVALAAGACSSTSSTASPVPTSSTAAPGTTAPAVNTTTATVASPTSTGAVAVATCARPHAPGQSSQSFTFQGVSRTYQLYVPAAYTGTKPVPVVFDFHGFGSNATEQMIYGNFKPEADRDDFLVVAPDGQVPADRHFNLTGEKGLQDDVQMVGALLDRIEAGFCVDAHRVYSTGMSDGGGMTSVLACRMSDRFAAFGAVAVIVACGGPKPVPIMAFSGTADPVVPFNGGRVNCCGGAQIGGAPTAMANWAAHDKCSATFRDIRLSSEVTRRTWSGCAPGSAAIFYIINGGGHTWPGSIPIDRLGKTTKQIDASATIWKFFRAHSLA